MRGKTDAMIAATNQVYVNYGIMTKSSLVYAYQHPAYKLDEKNCEDAIYHLTKTDGQLVDVHFTVLSIRYGPNDYCPVLVLWKSLGVPRSF